MLGTADMKTFQQFVEQFKGYIPKDLHRRSVNLIDKGINPDNPDRMNTNLQFKDKVHQMTPKPIERKIQPFAPDENLPPKINPSSKKGRLLKNILPGGKVA